MQLLNSCRTINVTSYEQWALVLLGLQHIGKLTREGCLTRTLQTRHQDDSRTTFEVELYSLTTHQLCQLVVHNLHHQLAWLDGCEHIHTQRLLLDSISKLLGYFIVDVGIQQCLTHIFQRLCNVNLGDFSFTFQYLERAFKSIT